MLVYTILPAFIVVFWPLDAFAWGPGTHLEIATSLLKNVSMFSPLVIPIIKKYRDEFVYGMISADILVGKKYAGYLNHSHNWNVAWRILEACKTDKERSSAYGYLTHLATDIIAHNYYIPYMIIKSYDSKVINHTYWELRFDMHVKKETWDEIGRIIKCNFKTFDKLLEANLKRPMFSFKTNKKIFSTILMLQKFGQLRKSVEIHSRFSQWPLKNSEVRHYKYLAVKTAREFLKKLDKASCIKGEPTGLDKLKYANTTRKSLRRICSRGLAGKTDVDKFIARIRIMLKETMFETGSILPDPYEVM